MDTVRGLAIVLVVAFHTDGEVRGETHQGLGWIHEACEALGPVRMPLLMFLSGMLLSKSLSKGTRRYLKGKLAHIAWPYLVWTSVNLAQIELQWHRGWEYWARMFYEPPTYHWYLAYLLVYYVVVLGLPPWLRTAIIPVALLTAHLTPYETDKLIWLFGWFLLGDLVTRWKLPLTAPTVPALAAIGRESLTYYVTHLSVIIVAVDAFSALGVTEPFMLFTSVVAVTLAVGRAFVVLRRRYVAVDSLFVWPPWARRSRLRPKVPGPRSLVRLTNDSAR